MGYLKEKYTESYYTGIDKKGEKLGYGVTNSFDEQGVLTLREHDALILGQIDFHNKNVLSLGCGRGEEIVYAIEHGCNIDNLVGVDFSPFAIKIAKSLIKRRKLPMPHFYNKDAIDFVSNYKKEISKDSSKKFDIVIMLDFIEHVPRDELKKVLNGLKPLLSNESILIVNTPVYKYDNDLIKKGEDLRNQVETYDKSDIIPETKGMHCNKFTIVSLQNFMRKNDFINVTEAHYFVPIKNVDEKFGNRSYKERWEIIKREGFPVLNEYKFDQIEYPYPMKVKPSWVEFKEGVLKGVTLLLTEQYKNIEFPKGDTDVEMMEDIEANKPLGKIIFDVGMFIGSSSLVFSKLVGRNGSVVGFEPNPFNRNRIFLNLSNNPLLAKRILTFPYALGASNSKERMNLSSEIDTGASSTSRLIEGHPKIRDLNLPDSFEYMIVEVKTLDSFVKEYSNVPDIVKVDVEGGEYNFLVGAIGTIRKYHPVFYIEMHSEYCALKCSELLNIEGYTLKVLKEEEDNRVMIKAFYEKDKILKHHNSMFGPKLKRDLYITKSIIEDLSIYNNKLLADNHKLATDNNKLLADNHKLATDNNKLLVEGEELKSRSLVLEAKVKEIESDNKRIKTELEYSKGVISNIENSKSWKITKPLRKFRHLIELFKTQGIKTTLKNIFYKLIEK